MQLKITLEKLILILLITTMIGCSSKKNIDNVQNEQRIMSINNKNIKNNGSSFNEDAYLKLYQLQQNNIIYFDLDKYNIHSNFFEILDTHANFLRNNLLYKVILEGHTDERGTPEYNISLGERRANSVKMYLQSKGVSNEQISIISYGKEKPVVLGHNESAYAKNRRVVLIY